jgi:hypothetical protein
MVPALVFLGKPGIRMISPVMGTRNPAPLAITISRTVTRNPWSADQIGLSRKGFLGLGYANGQLIEAVFINHFQVSFGIGR